MLLENFDYLKSINKNKLTTLNFAVQKNNFKDLQNFVDLCQHYSFNASIHGLDNWGTWNTDDVSEPDTWTIKNGTFQQHDVLNKDHIQYQECKQIIQTIESDRLGDIITKRIDFVSSSSQIILKAAAVADQLPVTTDIRFRCHCWGLCCYRN